MRAIWPKRAAGALVAAAATAAVIWFGWPEPIAVDIAAVTKGPMEVTVDDEARTRIRHIYTVTAPVTGKVLRISRQNGNQSVSRHVGDQVTADETIVAVMQPTAPSFLDVRSLKEIQAAVAAAEAVVKFAEAEVRRIQAVLEFSRDELRRAQALARSDAISARALDKAKLDVETNEAALASAKAQLEVRRREQASAAARLIEPSSAISQPNLACCIQLRAPVTGRVLTIIQESETVVEAGVPLIAIGDPRDLEVVAELLSTDAVRVNVGAPVRIDGWGGPPIRGRVTRVDPAGFVKISALGIEEQRVRTTIDFVDPPDTWSRLGHDYRVIVHVTIWEGTDVVAVPIGALFRKDDNWAVFTVANGRARTTLVQIGHRNNRMAEVISGLSAGDLVVLHPSDRVKEGISVSERESR